MSVKVFAPGDDDATTKPFFEATLKPFNYLPAVPFSLKLISWLLGKDTVMPPLPGSENPGKEIICPTEHWKHLSFGFYTRMMRLMWVDVSSLRAGRNDETGDGESNVAEAGVDGGSKGWWPYYKTWRVGCWIDEATLTVSTAEELK